MNWHEWIDMNQVTWMTWHEGIETHELKRMNWDEWIEMKQLRQMNWTEWVKWLTWHEWINWHEKVEKNSVFYVFCDQLLDDDVVDIWNRALTTVSCTFWQPHFQKRKNFCSFFYDLYVKSSSRYSLARPHLQKVQEKTVIFLRLLCETQLSLITVPCAFCPLLSGARRAPAETDTLQRRPPMVTLFTRKSTGFCAWECFQPWIRMRSGSLPPPNYLMMIWLTWWVWCGWHDGATAGCENCS